MPESGASPNAAEERPSAPPEPPEPSPPTRLFLVRHAQSTWNDSERIQGQLDPPLSEFGRRQAERLAERLAERKWAGFYSSDLKRATETAQPLADRINCRPVEVPELREIDLGEWEGLTRQEVVDRYPREWKAWVEQPDYDLVPGGEGARRFEERVTRALDDIFSRHPSGDVLVVTHGGVIQVALGQVVGRSTHGFFPFRTDNTSITVLDLMARSRLVVRCVNDTCHLEGLHRQPTSGDLSAAAH